MLTESHLSELPWYVPKLCSCRAIAARTAFLAYRILATNGVHSLTRT